NEGLSRRSAVHILYPQAVPLKAVIDPAVCLWLKNGKCVKTCQKACGVNAIDFDQQPQTLDLNVGAVVLAPGFNIYNARQSEEFGYGRYANVVTAIEFERLLSASGPTNGHITRPSDKQEPKRIAFFQCVGSRDQNHKYCSSVCCMYATKEAMLAMEHVPGVECQIFFMDMRAFGKGYDAFFERAKSQGVKYTRCRISSVKEVPGSKELLIKYQSEDGEMRLETFDLVVLSVGMEPPKGAAELAAITGIELNEHGFCRTNPLNPIETSKPGVFVCGTFAEPKDISESVTQASGAAGAALQTIGTARGTLVEEKVYPRELAVEGEEPRIGVFVCHCGNNIAGVVNVPDVVEYARGLPGVVHADNIIYACAADSLKALPETIKEHRLNRVVVASCTPRTHEPLFQDTLREAGLNPYLFEMANIRDQCSWVHSKEPEKATDKSRSLIKMAVWRASTLEPIHETKLELNHRALVIGGGVSGMTSALSLASQGFQVFLVERDKQLGGNLRNLSSTVQGIDPKSYVESLLKQIAAAPLIEVLTGVAVAKVEGFIGAFKTTLETVDSPIQRLIEHGVTIVATGAQEYRGSEYLLGQHPNIITQGDLEARLSPDGSGIPNARSVVMIQCVGPWAEKEFYCSRVCCGVAVKNALRIKRLDPSTQVYVLYWEMRTYGFKEDLYTKAREEGVIFVRYDRANPPVVQDTDSGVRVEITDPILNERLQLNPDYLVLSTAMVPRPEGIALAPILKVPQSREGFFLEAHIKLRPVDFSSEGMFLCGTAHYPKFISECVVQAAAAAGRAATVLTKEMLTAGAIVAVVTPEKCTACLTCVRVCPFSVPFINAEGLAEIRAAECRGCGICASECPAKAIEILNYKDRQIVAKTDALLSGF
ncbi:MAG: FAD-dependent oxidoreductase, partial [Dehalococcoidia bacterium]|nr:FAD-dependent oxidoreductase [Dehalococcoidia bacterium]